VSGVLTLDHPRSAPNPPSMRRAPPQPEATQRVSTVAPPLSKVTQSVRTVAPEGERPESPAALTERSVRATLIEELRKALIEAIELSKTMVAEDEAAPINDQTYFYAVEVLAPVIIAMKLPVPLILPLQNGGIGAEWHDHGMNIELRFRNPYHIYAVLEDARGEILPFHGRDPHLVRARVALHEFTTRASERD
jgi:hypothetical protein